jgi:hypothetical protein
MISCYTYDVSEKQNLQDPHVGEKSARRKSLDTHHEHPMSALIEQFKNWERDQEYSTARSRGVSRTPFAAFFLSTSSSDEAESTRRWSSSRPMSPSVNLMSRPHAKTVTSAISTYVFGPRA